MPSCNREQVGLGKLLQPLHAKRLIHLGIAPPLSNGHCGAYPPPHASFIHEGEAYLRATLHRWDQRALLHFEMGTSWENINLDATQKSNNFL